MGGRFGNRPLHFGIVGDVAVAIAGAAAQFCGGPPAGLVLHVEERHLAAALDDHVGEGHPLLHREPHHRLADGEHRNLRRHLGELGRTWAALAYLLPEEETAP